MKKTTFFNFQKPKASYPVKSRNFMNVYKLFLIPLTCLLCFGISTAQPLNDDCASAITLTEGAGCVIGTNVGATTQTLDMLSCNTGAIIGVPTNSVWYKFTPPATGTYTVSCDNGNNALGTNTQLKLFEGSCSTPSLVVCGEDVGPIEQGKNYQAAQLTHTLTGGTVYYIMVDIVGIQTGNFCINVYKNVAPVNDCINQALNITSMISGISSANPFDCSSYIFNASTNTTVHPTEDVVLGDANLCNGLSGSSNNDDHRDVWFKFTLSNTSPDVWLSLFQNAYKEGELHYGMAVYRGTYTQSGSCPSSSSSISGLTLVDCSSGASYLPNSSGGTTDVGKCSTPINPRIDISNLYADHGGGTYILRIWEYGGGEPTPGIFKLCIEAAPVTGIGIDGLSADRCIEANNVGCDNDEINQDFDEAYEDLSNAGMQGSIFVGNGGTACIGPNPDEPLRLIVSPATMVNCDADYAGIVQKNVNNSAIYTFSINNGPVIVHTRNELVEEINGLMNELRQLDDDPTYQMLLDEIQTALDIAADVASEATIQRIFAMLDELEQRNSESAYRIIIDQIRDVLETVEEEISDITDVISKTTIRFSNIEVEGTNGAKVLFYVIPAACELNASDALMSGAADCLTDEIELCSETGSLPNGDYFIIVDGQDGAIARYDMRIIIRHTTVLGEDIGTICSTLPRKANPVVDAETGNQLMIGQLSPMPAQSELIVEYYAGSAGNIELSVIGIDGKLNRIPVPSHKGMNTYKLDVNGLSSGVYIIQLENAEGFKSAQRFIKIK